MDVELLQHALERQDAALAFRLCDEALRRDADDPDALYWKGQLARMQGDLNGGVSWLSHAYATVDGRDDFQRIGFVGLAYGISLQQSGMLEDAVRVFTCAASRAAEDSALLYNSLGITLKMMGRLAEALDAYNRGLEADRHQVMVEAMELKKWGWERSADGRTAIWMSNDASETIMSILSDRGHTSALLGNVASALLVDGDVDRATKALVRCVGLGDHSGQAQAALNRLGVRLSKEHFYAAAQTEAGINRQFAARIAAENGTA